MRKFIAQVVEVIEDEICSSEVEELCREHIVDEILNRARLITQEEIETLLAPIIKDEISVDPMDKVEGDSMTLTDIEFENLPEDIKAIDDDEPVVVAGGRVWHPSIIRDMTAKRMAAKISSEINQTLHGLRLAQEITDAEMAEAFLGEDTGCCPNCQGEACTLVWVDGGSATLCCDACGEEFVVDLADIQLPEDDETMAIRTVEDFDIVPGLMFCSMWFEGMSYCYDIYSDGEVVFQGEAETPEEVYAICEDIAKTYNELMVGMDVFSAGKRLKITAMDDELIQFGTMCGKRAKIAISLMEGKMTLGNEDLYTDTAKVGDFYQNEHGSSMNVYRVSNDGEQITYEDVDAAERSANYTVRNIIMSRQEFFEKVVDGNYSLR